jgi:ferredoxin
MKSWRKQMNSINNGIMLKMICTCMVLGYFFNCSDSYEKLTINPENSQKAFLRIDAKSCMQCGACFKSCPVNAISEHVIDNQHVYIIDPQKCIRCGICINNCPYGAIDWKR